MSIEFKTNGYCNSNTYLMSVWLANDENINNDCIHLAKSSQDIHELSDMIYEYCLGLFEKVEQSQYLEDMFTSVDEFRFINWLEIAETYEDYIEC